MYVFYWHFEFLYNIFCLVVVASIDNYHLLGFECLTSYGGKAFRYDSGPVMRYYSDRCVHYLSLPYKNNPIITSPMFTAPKIFVMIIGKLAISMPYKIHITAPKNRIVYVVIDMSLALFLLNIL